MKTRRLAVSLLTVALATLAAAGASGCAATGHAVTPAHLGVARTSQSLEAVVDEPGPVTVDTRVAADWEVDRSGLLDLDSPVAKQAGITDGREPIQLLVHVVRHPTRGVFLVDSGVEHAFLADPGHALIHGFLGNMAHLEKLVVHEDTQAIVARAREPVQGVLLTHLHLDHVLGLRDLPSSTPVYVGAGDPEDRSFMNLFQRGVYDQSLDGKGAIRELHFEPDPDGTFEGVLDLFGDGTFWALLVPGHTPGSVAFVARTPDGPVLLTGDACHTVWGWQHDVEPGTFSDDRAKSAESLARLERFAAKHPRMKVRLGHQTLPKQ